MYRELVTLTTDVCGKPKEASKSGLNTLMFKSLLFIKDETDEVTGPSKLLPDVSKSESPTESVTPPVPSSYF